MDLFALLGQVLNKNQGEIQINRFKLFWRRKPNRGKINFQHEYPGKRYKTIRAFL